MTAPVILYIQGGPGLSSLFGLFLENGPFQLDGAEKLRRRESTWVNSHNLLYMDSPVGTGFSFANNSAAYATEQKEVARDLYLALIQFFLLFPSLQTSDFYIAGTSYSGKTIPVLGYKIHTENERDRPNLRINLKGVLIGSGYFDGSIQDDYADFYFQLGLLDEKQREDYRQSEVKLNSHVKNKEYSKARAELSELVLGKFKVYTGFNDIFMYNALHAHTPSSVRNLEKFLHGSCIKHLLHTGGSSYHLLSAKVYSKFKESDFYFSPKKELEALLSAKYKVLFYSAQFDLIVTYVGVTKFIKTLEWYGANRFEESPRKVWRINTKVEGNPTTVVAGYVKEYENLIHVLIRNSGHTACGDQPLWCEDMVSSFTRAK